MTTFLKILQESKKQYEFKLRIANIDTDSKFLDKLEVILQAFELADISKPKSIPVQEHPILFPALGPCEVVDINLTLNYPCIAEQIRAMIVNLLKVPAQQVVVLPKGVDEEQYVILNHTTNKNKKALLNTELEDDGIKGDDYYGDKMVSSFLKDLNTRKYDIAGEATPKAKTTNEIPQQNTSPVGKPDFNKFKDIFKKTSVR